MKVSIYTLPPTQRNAALEAIRRAGRGRRVYQLAATGPGGHRVPTSPDCCVSDARIRQLLVNRFRAVFGGRVPSFTWASNGWMGEAWDNRGNRLCVHQLNNLPG